jgi:hypothetical protein
LDAGETNLQGGTCPQRRQGAGQRWQLRRRLRDVPRILPARFWIESDAGASTVVAKFTALETVGKPCGLSIFHDCKVPESADDFT